MKYTLVLDIGNTETDIGLFEKGQLQKTWFIRNGEMVDYVKKGKKLNTLNPKKVDNIIMGSVNPPVTRLFQSWCMKTLGKPALLLKAPYKNIIKIKYRPVSSLGIDRLADAVAAEREYPVPLVVIDFGTATTFNIVNQKHEFIGGAISIGLEMAKNILPQKTALLPEIQIKNIPDKKIISVIGQTTQSSLQSGIIHGFASLLDGMVDKIRKELKLKRIHVIATGGYARVIKPYSKSIRDIDPYLTLKGIYHMGVRQWPVK